MIVLASSAHADTVISTCGTTCSGFCTLGPDIQCESGVGVTLTVGAVVINSGMVYQNVIAGLQAENGDDIRCPFVSGIGMLAGNLTTMHK
jgi:hypothetical protein